MKTASAWQKVGIAALAAGSAFGVGAWIRTHSSSGEASDEVVAPVVRATPSASASAAAASDTPTAATLTRLEPDVAFNPFGPLNLGTPAALGQPSAPPPKPKKAKQVAVPAPPPPAPTAPPLPFVAMGSLNGAEVTGGQPVAFLQQQDQLLVVRAGQPVGNNYRVESITSQRIEFTYLPLMQRQSLPLAP